MPRIQALPREELSDFEPLFAQIEHHLGVLPNSTLTMGHRPEIMQAFAALNAAVMNPGLVPQGLKQMVAAVASAAAGCRYCQAHTSHVAEMRGVSAEKMSQLWSFESSPLFDDAERAALRVALGAGTTPNAVTDESMADLRTHFSDAQIVEIVAVISVFGFLNRWNDTMATELEQSPLAYAGERLAPSGWSVGRHAQA